MVGKYWKCRTCGGWLTQWVPYGGFVHESFSIMRHKPRPVRVV